VVLAVWGCLCAMVGLCAGNIARSSGQAVGLGIAGTMALAALGGCWWPIEITPKWMQSLAACLPTGWTMHAIHQLVSFQSGPAAALAPLALLLGATLVMGVVAARTFRYSG
jgi:ABC-type multidrug transport system permease subunit